MTPAKFWIAQHISDLFRNEPRNIGVFIALNGNTFAKFLGETESGDIDGRKLRSFKFPDVYRQWIEYWRGCIETGKIDNIEKSSGSHYRLIEGGEFDVCDSDSIEQIANSIYKMLISGEGSSW